MENDFYIIQGADYNTTIDLVNNDGTPINIAGYNFTGIVKKSVYSANATANLVIVATSNANGNVTISMPANVSANIENGTYLYTIDMLDTSNISTTILQGLFVVLPSTIINQTNNYPKFYLSNVAPYNKPVTPYN